MSFFLNSPHYQYISMAPSLNLTKELKFGSILLEGRFFDPMIYSEVKIRELIPGIEILPESNYQKLFTQIFTDRCVLSVSSERFQIDFAEVSEKSWKEVATPILKTLDDITFKKITYNFTFKVTAVNQSAKDLTKILFYNSTPFFDAFENDVRYGAYLSCDFKDARLRVDARTAKTLREESEEFLALTFNFILEPEKIKGNVNWGLEKFAVDYQEESTRIIKFLGE